MGRNMAAIIDDDVKWTIFVDNGLEEGGIALITDFHMNIMLRRIEGGTTFIDVDADDNGAISKKTSPQLQRCTSVNANFEHARAFPVIRSELTVICLEIAEPLMTAWNSGPNLTRYGAVDSREGRKLVAFPSDLRAHFRVKKIVNAFGCHDFLLSQLLSGDMYSLMLQALHPLRV